MGYRISQRWLTGLITVTLLLAVADPTRAAEFSADTIIDRLGQKQQVKLYIKDRQIRAEMKDAFGQNQILISRPGKDQTFMLYPKTKGYMAFPATAVLSPVDQNEKAAKKTEAANGSDKQGVQNDFDHVYSLFPVLSERRSQVAGTLSGGEQQMLAIGRSLMSKPKLLMMDEPSIGLSPLVKNQLADSIVDIWKSGITVLIVEQDASLTLELTQRVYIMEHGKVGLEGKSNELIDNEEVKRVYFQLG